MLKSDITICTVDYSSADVLAMNISHTKKLNERSSFTWSIVTNDVTGVENRLRKEIATSSILPLDEASNSSWCAGSYQHARGLNTAIKNTSTRYVVALDPDFFILTPEWCGQVTAYMNSNNISFFGAPYSPGRFIKYRYFPSAVCMFIDCETIPLKDVDFFPDFESRNTGDLQAKKRSRWNIGQSRDVGWRIYEKFGLNTSIKSECLQQSWEAPSKKVSISQILDRFLPDSYAYRPQKNGYTVTKTFAECGLELPTYPGILTEEFFWNDKPFGIHLRSRLQESLEAKAWSDALDRTVE